MEYLFPPGFLWGSATASYQIEGGNKNSDWWEIEGELEKEIRDSGGVAHYHHFREDTDLADSLHLNSQRLSLEWSRLEPKEGIFDRQEVNHYHEVLNSLKEKGTKVFLTLHHFSNPLWFEERGGWENASRAWQLFTRFARFCVQEFSSSITAIITINEPNLYAGIYPLKDYFPEKKLPWRRALQTYGNLLSIHREAFKTIKQVNPNLPVGLSVNLSFIQPYDRSPLSFLASTLTNWAQMIHLDPIFRHDSDFIGLNYYYHLRSRFNLLNPRRLFELHNGESAMFSQGLGGSSVVFDASQVNHGENFSDIGWQIYPEGLYRLLIKLKSFQKPIYVTENGLSDGSDKLRARFIQSHLLWLHRAIQDGADVRGYFYWTLMDNFEWFQGYKPRFGLIEVNYLTKKRTIRPSAWEFSKICQSNKLIV